RAVLLWSWFHPAQANRPTPYTLAEPDLRNKAKSMHKRIFAAWLSRHWIKRFTPKIR
ncbi:hypothetical protein ABIB38_004853, partial [Massilia sp. UYP11]